MKIRGIFVSTCLIMISNNALSDNVVYIDQAGDSATISITQDGTDNSVGSSNIVSRSGGVSTVIDIDQIGASNAIDYAIYGDRASVTANIISSSSLVSLSVGTTGGSNAGSDDITILLDVSVNNSNEIDFNVGAVASGVDDVTIDVSISGGTNIVSVNEESTAVVILNDKLTQVDVSGSLNTLNIGKSGAGQHDTIISHTGDSSMFDVAQAGAENSTVNVLSNGSGSSFNINISD